MRTSYATEVLPGRPHPMAVTPFVRAPRNVAAFTVPEGHYFMMGDNRDVSFDSRFFGCVPRKQIVGRAQVVVFSLDRENWWMPRGVRWGKVL